MKDGIMVGVSVLEGTGVNVSVGSFVGVLIDGGSVRLGGTSLGAGVNET